MSKTITFENEENFNNCFRNNKRNNKAFNDYPEEESKEEKLAQDLHYLRSRATRIKSMSK